MRTATITWHSYPEDKPSESGGYLVKTEFGEVYITSYHDEHGFYETCDEVVEWAEIPE